MLFRSYAAVNRIRLDDQRPYIYRTHDGGKSWKEIVNGLGDSGPINVVREDPVRRGLLFCGSERAVYVSFNDGDTWQPLRLNMPASSIRDLVVKDDDLVVGTHGRSFWILDDITPLRQITDQMSASEAFLFKPQTTYRVRWNMNTDTPLPPEEPAGQNPPDGACINYYLKARAAGPVVLEITDTWSKMVARFSSADKPDDIEAIGKEVNIPSYWIRPSQVLSTEPGMHRFVWNLHYPAPEGQRPEYPIAAIYGDTERHPLGPWVLPGEYIVKLTVGGRSDTQSLTVKMDPRVKTPPEGLSQQHEIAMQSYQGMKMAREAIEQIRKLRAQLRTLHDRAGQGPVSDAITALERKAAALEGAGGGFRGGGGGGQNASTEPSLSRVSGELLGLMNLVEEADMAPTSQARAASGQAQQSLAGVLQRWRELKEKDVVTLNDQLRRANLQPVDTGK